MRSITNRGKAPANDPQGKLATLGQQMDGGSPLGLVYVLAFDW